MQHNPSREPASSGGWSLRVLAALGALVSIVGLAPPPSLGQDDATFDATVDPPRFQWRFEARTHYRDSEDVRFQSPLEFLMEALPPGENHAFLETPDAGSHVEVSMVTARFDARFTERLRGRLRLDLIDRHDRNPTSEDRDVDLDEAWLLFGHEWQPATVPDRRGGYVKIGKFPKFERQNDPHLESYGLIATAFNRFEDVGLEAGVDIGRHFYVKAQLTEGNPLFFRDPNALAGDNGTTIFNGSVLNPVSKIKTGLPIFYDADVDTIAFDNPELGNALGWRYGSPSGLVSVDVMVWAYRRHLADEAPIHNTFYGGDLDLLLGPGNETPLPVTNHRKREVGANVWLYAGDLTLFGQYVDQSLAGLDRDGYEIELSWTIDLPLFASLGGRQLFPWIAPAVRYSNLDPDFALHPMYPAPSVAWDWEKLDLGIRLGLWRESDLTVEWAKNDFIVKGEEKNMDELLVTLRLRFDHPDT